MAGRHDMIVVGAGMPSLTWDGKTLQLTMTRMARSGRGQRAGLRSNNLHGTYQYPDMDMTPGVYDVKEGEHIPGAVLHKYLTDFAKKFGVFERTRFSTKVDSLEPSQDNGWQLETSTPDGPKTFRTKKIIIATGLTSQPNFPVYSGAETFDAPYFHAKDFCKQSETLTTTKNAVVIGGAKSAMDVAFAYAETGAEVDMVIRRHGNGPVWISYPWVMGGKKRLEKLLTVRWMTWFSPCPWGGEDGWLWARRFLHGTAIGRFIVNQFWGGLGGEVLQVNGYDSHPELQKLKPWNSAFWIGSGLSIHNYPQDFFQMVKDGKIRVHVSDVERLTARTVHLADGQALKSDLLVCATGWRKDPSIRFQHFGTAGIGLTQVPAEQRKLATAADEKVLSLYPRLRDQPTLNFKPKADPYRLYRFMIPPGRFHDRNIAFAGMTSSVSTSNCASAQALWIAAFLDGRLDREAATPEAVTDEIMLHTQWGKWRYPCGYGAAFPDFVFDALPYIDLLLKDLGLNVNRKKGWLADISEPYGPGDWAGLVDEWVAVHKKAA
nr:dimethylaniline monooxygenase [n-oxide-forming] 1 [Quercus suber]